MPTTTAGPAQRLLDAAARLFDREGIRAVGIDRILATAGVARASLYQHYGSKDALVTAYLERADRNDRSRYRQSVRGLDDDPLGRIRAAFDLAAAAARRRGYRGCLYLNAATEFPGPASPVAAVVAEHRARQRTVFREALVQLGHPDPDETTARIQLVYDGGLAGSKAERSSEPIERAAGLAIAMATSS
ncbi:transcriptional regulator, TetR family [Pseudonocardia ammonioxydans]|uniref:Transcriptional regulator, TetR family n=1 Tax=Pseudonocardia ammonioxydans TaxID=260086 RepID=A0A1I5BG02_PSUAM|nr:helix-turn-helix domain-containing protein [Pseudonocardia ammonioxydans]SFN73489.1 transcriptional regulator, TetR family [Pseudonocardia ammonioxydans]